MITQMMIDKNDPNSKERIETGKRLFVSQYQTRNRCWPRGSLFGVSDIFRILSLLAILASLTVLFGKWIGR